LNWRWSKCILYSNTKCI